MFAVTVDDTADVLSVTSLPSVTAPLKVWLLLVLTLPPRRMAGAVMVSESMLLVDAPVALLMLADVPAVFVEVVADD